jgi:hypothetical protein
MILNTYTTGEVHLDVSLVALVEFVRYFLSNTIESTEVTPIVVLDTSDVVEFEASDTATTASGFAVEVSTFSAS